MTLRIGLLGAGGIADNHCKTINEHPEATVVAVADPNRARREEVCRTHNVARGHAGWEALVSDPEIDAVVIALPNALHAPASLAALRAGKHVLLEKPFALNAAEARSIAAAARRHRRVLMVGMNQRYRPEAQRLREIVRRGDLGEIFHAKAYWYRRQGAPKFGTWFGHKALSGGGCLLDIGVHYLDLALYLIDNWEPVRVSGKAFSVYGRRGRGEGSWGKSVPKKSLAFDVDDFAGGLIRFRNGATLELNVSWILPLEQPNRQNVELFGTEAGAALDPLRIFREGRVRGEYEIVTPDGVAVPHLYTNRQANWIDAILGRDNPLCEISQSLVVQRILDAIYKSSETGREVTL